MPKAIKDTAIVKVTSYLRGPYPQPLQVMETSMTQDLPADNLGEIVADAIQACWKQGHDPVNVVLTVEFR